MGVSVTRIVKFIRKGEKGDRGNSVIAAVTSMHRHTLAVWQKIGEAGYCATWVNISNASDMKIGDTMVIQGVVTDKDDISITYYGTVVTISNTTVKATATALIMSGQDGKNGSSFAAQYSVDGETNWHDTFAVGDIYMRTSADGGATWSNAIRIVGEKGDETDYQFAWSSHKSLEDGEDPLSDVVDWCDYPPERTDTSKPYLWTKITTPDGNVSYARLTGEKGDSGKDAISIYVDPSVILHKKAATNSTYYVTVKLKEGETYVGYGSNFGQCVAAMPTYTVESSGLSCSMSIVSGGIDYIRYAFTIKANAEVNTDATIKVTYKTVTYERTIPIKTVTNGDQGESVESADVVFCVHNTGTTAPDDTAKWVTLFSQLTFNQGHYVWTCTKTTLTNNTVAYTGKRCLGKCEDLADTTEEYALSDSGTTAPTEGWAETYTAEEGKWLWTRVKVDRGTLVMESLRYYYTDPVCVGRFGKDGNPGEPGKPGEKGDRGPALRGPQAWSDCAVGYLFQSGADDEEYKDVVLYNNNYYSCVKSHAKTTDNAPLSTADTSDGYWKLADKFEIIATKILLAQYALVKNLGVEVIDMKDSAGNIVFQAKDGNVICNSGTFNSIKVTGNSEFSGTMKGVSGSFKSLNCVDDNGNIVGSIAFGSDGKMWFDGDMYSQGYNSKESRSNRFYTSDVWCRGMFGHYKKTVAVVKGTYMYVYSKGADKSGVYVSLSSGKTSDNEITFYKIPLYGLTNDDLAGMPIDVIVFNTSSDYYYQFTGAGGGKEWRVINGNDKQSVHFCGIEGWHSLSGGSSVNCMYINPDWLNPVPAANEIGRGVFWTGETDLNWQ